MSAVNEYWREYLARPETFVTAALIVLGVAILASACMGRGR
jgi:hypothetical protein